MKPERLHGFYYTQKNGDLYGLKLPPVCEQIMGHAVRMGFGKLSNEDYWLKLGGYMITHCPQGYLAWEGQCYWLILAGPNIRNLKQSYGVHLVRFSGDRTLGYQWLNGPDYKKFEDPDLQNTDRDFVGGGLAGEFRKMSVEHFKKDPLGSGLDLFAHTPWDWLLEKNYDDEMFPLSAGLKRAIEANIEWTQPMHEEMAKKYPPEKHWA